MSDIEFFEKFHVLYDENGNVIGYVEKRAEETINNFRAAEEQWKESQGSDVGSTQPTQEEVTSMFVEASGGYNKGRLYGCGPKQYKKPSRIGISGSSSSSSSQVPNEEMREELERLRRAEALNTAKIQKLESFMADYLRRNGDGNGSGSAQ